MSVLGDEQYDKFGFTAEANVEPSVPSSKPGRYQHTDRHDSSPVCH